MRRRKIKLPAALLVCVTALLLLAAAPALATVESYWGYNNMTSTNPAASSTSPYYSVECYGDPAGYACSGFNNWDRSSVDWNSGSAAIAYGFENCSTCTYYSWAGDYAKVWTMIRTDFNTW